MNTQQEQLANECRPVLPYKLTLFRMQIADAGFLLHKLNKIPRGSSEQTGTETLVCFLIVPYVTSVVGCITRVPCLP